MARHAVEQTASAWAWAGNALAKRGGAGVASGGHVGGVVLEALDQGLQYAVHPRQPVRVPATAAVARADGAAVSGVASEPLVGPAALPAYCRHSQTSRGIFQVRKLVGKQVFAELKHLFMRTSP